MKLLWNSLQQQIIDNGFLCASAFEWRTIRRSNITSATTRMSSMTSGQVKNTAPQWFSRLCPRQYRINRGQRADKTIVRRGRTNVPTKCYIHCWTNNDGYVLPARVNNIQDGIRRLCKRKDTNFKNMTPFIFTSNASIALAFVAKN